MNKIQIVNNGIKLKKIILSISLIVFVFRINAQENKIEPVGNVGIGTLNPNFGLTINSIEDQTSLGGNIKSVLRIVNGYANSFGRKSEIQFSLGQSSNQLLAVIAAEYSSWNNNVGGELIFGTTPTTSNTIIERLRIDENGNVGIGTDNLGAKLQVHISGSERAFRIKNGLSNSSFNFWTTEVNNKKQLRIDEDTNGTNVVTFFQSGNVGIGTTNPDMKLTVKGKIHAEEVKIDLAVPAPDYVFREDYNLRSLNEVEKFIKKNNHLPEIPSAKEFKNNGLMLAEMDMNLLRKVEELTLYTIQQQKEIEIFKKENKKLQKIAEKFNDLQSRLEKLESIK